jgi:hypothetical protein
LTPMSSLIHNQRVGFSREGQGVLEGQAHRESRLDLPGRLGFVRRREGQSVNWKVKPMAKAGYCPPYYPTMCKSYYCV